MKRYTRIKLRSWCTPSCWDLACLYHWYKGSTSQATLKWLHILTAVAKLTMPTISNSPDSMYLQIMTRGMEKFEIALHLTLNRTTKTLNPKPYNCRTATFLRVQWKFKAGTNGMLVKCLGFKWHDGYVVLNLVALNAEFEDMYATPPHRKKADKQMHGK